jgi:hypothetical protein
MTAPSLTLSPTLTAFWMQNAVSRGCFRAFCIQNAVEGSVR